ITASDAAGNTTPCTVTVTVTDNTPPTVNCPAVPPQSAYADATGSALVPDVCSLVRAQSSDNCTAGSALIITQNPAKGATVSGSGSHPIQVTVADAAANSTPCTVAFTVIDSTPPTFINNPGNVSVNNDSGTCGASVMLPAPVVHDNCTPDGSIVMKCYLNYLVQATKTQISSPCTFPVGTTTVTIEATNAAGNHSTCGFTVTVTNPAPALTMAPVSQQVQYGCAVAPVTIIATDASDPATALTTPTVSYTFSGGGGSASTLPPGLSLSSASSPGTCQVAGTITGASSSTVVGTYVITVGGVKDECGATSGSSSFTIIVTPALAQPVADTYYTGSLFYWTAGPSSSTATLTLTATLKNQLCFGDIRTAKVSFFVRNGTTMTPITGAQNLPVGLVTPGDTTVGTAAATVQYNIGSAQGTALQIAVVVCGKYLANDPTADASMTV